MMIFFFALSVLFAQEPSKSTDILFRTPPTEKQSLLLHSALKKYLRESKEVFVGVLEDTRPVRSTFGFDTVVQFKVDSWLKGGAEKSYIERLLPYRSPYAFGNPMSVQPILIKGYKVLVFVNKYGAIIDGNALFVVVDDHVFRNKRPDIFLNPIYDRRWSSGNPHEDYFIYPFDSIERSVRRNTPVLK